MSVHYSIQYLCLSTVKEYWWSTACWMGYQHPLTYSWGYQDYPMHYCFEEQHPYVKTHMIHDAWDSPSNMPYPSMFFYKRKKWFWFYLCEIAHQTGHAQSIFFYKRKKMVWILQLSFLSFIFDHTFRCPDI